jgi:hypothetical protein
MKATVFIHSVPDPPSCSVLKSETLGGVLEHTHVQAPLCRLVLRLLSVSTGPIVLVLAALSKE